LAALLEVSEGKRVSELERLGTPPVKTTGTAMVRAMERVEEISAAIESGEEAINQRTLLTAGYLLDEQRCGQVGQRLDPHLTECRRVLGWTASPG
jgi:hypothetical protein